MPYLVWSGLACIVAYGAGQWREIAEAFKGRQARYGTLAGVSVLVVLGILIAVNYIGARQNKRWDLTANKSFSLSDQTRKVLEGLDSPLHLMVFVQEPDFSRFKDRLQAFPEVRDRVIRYMIINGEVVFERRTKRRRN